MISQNSQCDIRTPPSWRSTDSWIYADHEIVAPQSSIPGPCEARVVQLIHPGSLKTLQIIFELKQFNDGDKNYKISETQVLTLKQVIR